MCAFLAGTTLFDGPNDLSKSLSNLVLKIPNSRLSRTTTVKNCISYVAGWDATNKPGDAEYKKMIIIIPDLNKYMVRGQVNIIRPVRIRQKPETNSISV